MYIFVHTELTKKTLPASFEFTTLRFGHGNSKRFEHQTIAILQAHDMVAHET